MPKEMYCSNIRDSLYNLLERDGSKTEQRGQYPYVID